MTDFYSFDDIVAAIQSGTVSGNSLEAIDSVDGNIDQSVSIVLGSKAAFTLLNSDEIKTEMNKWLQELAALVQDSLVSYYVNEYTPKQYHRTYRLSDSVRTGPVLQNDDLYSGEVYFDPTLSAGHSPGVSKAINIDTGWCHRNWNGDEDHWHKFSGSWFVKRAIERFKQKYDGPFDLVIHVNHPDDLYEDTTLLGSEF